MFQYRNKLISITLTESHHVEVVIRDLLKETTIRYSGKKIPEIIQRTFFQRFGGIFVSVITIVTMVVFFIFYYK